MIHELSSLFPIESITVEWPSHIGGGGQLHHARNLHTSICLVLDQLLSLGACRQSSVIAKTVIFL